MKFTLTKSDYEVSLTRDDRGISIAVESDGKLIDSYMVLEFFEEGFHNEFSVGLIPAIGCHNSFLLVANYDKIYIYRLIFVAIKCIKTTPSMHSSIEEDEGKRIQITQNVDVRVMNLVMDKSFIEEDYYFNQFLNHRLHDGEETTGIVIERNMQIAPIPSDVKEISDGVDRFKTVRELFYIMDEDLDSRPGAINNLHHISGFIGKPMEADDVIIIRKGYDNDHHTLALQPK